MKPTPLKITSEERSKILEREITSLTRDHRPAQDEGDVIVIAMNRPRRYCDPDTGHVFDPPHTPAATIKITSIVRRAKGGWTINFAFTDRRQVSLLLAKGNGYTTSHRNAIDHLEAAVDSDDLARFALEARLARTERRDTRDEDRRRQERAIRSQISETLNKLPPVAQTLLLAQLHRTLADALQQEGHEAA